ncbi:cache domain-containing sensor histidine kinase [Anaerotalea alkaliphila]|uniref:HAMP domain-containing protein n=1 Tax=Anaerotalea alkaliphila TaxID=2662126 RepID=A0A7X5KMX8_9FIRM|nr:sensor histidine kinase [Anaerotalea alkaliphila]NDL67173.1 HAMP domain-containing protein [Anaerotalea alkaliphila]
MKLKMNIYNIRTRLVLAVSGIIVFVSIATLLLFYSFTNIFLAGKIADTTTDHLSKYSRVLDRYLGDAYYLATKTLTEEEFRMLLGGEEGLTPERQEALGSLLNREAEMNPVVDSIYYYSVADSLILTSDELNPKREVNNLGLYPWITAVTRTLGSVGNLYNISGHEDEVGLVKNRYVSLSRPVYGEKGDIRGILSVNMKEASVFSSFFYSITDSNGSHVHLVGTADDLVSSSQEGYGDKRILDREYYPRIREYSQGYTLGMEDGVEKLVVFVTHPLAEYMLVYTIPFRNVTSGMGTLRNLAILLSASGILTGVLILYRMSDSFYKPIRTLKGAMKGFEEGDFALRIREERNDEFRVLYRGFNNMAEGVTSLMDQTIRQKVRMDRVHYKTLQTQISPHFMYNTLYSIKCMAMLNKDTVTTQMLTAFIELLHVSTDNRVDLIPLETERKQIENYVVLQKKRYGDAFQVAFDIEEEYGAILVPKLILQPLVENSLKYGLDLKKGGGSIRIGARRVEDGFLLEVVDSGRKPDMERIREILDSDFLQDFREIGINNVNQRIKLIYGEAYGLSYEYREGQGLAARVHLGERPIANYDKI